MMRVKTQERFAVFHVLYIFKGIQERFAVFHVLFIFNGIQEHFVVVGASGPAKA
jgi:hypothetical protein